MKLEMLNDSKLKISFDSKELEENGISIHTYLSGSKLIKKFIYAILEIAEEELNFTFKNYKLDVESYSFNHTHFIIYITKDSSNFNSKNTDISSEITYMFKNQNEALSFIERNYNLFKNIFNLYKYKSNYYLMINTNNIDLKQTKRMQISLFDETAPYFTSNILNSKIKEFGKITLNNNNYFYIK